MEQKQRFQIVSIANKGGDYVRVVKIIEVNYMTIGMPC